jgi:hypothetical protein
MNGEWNCTKPNHLRNLLLVHVYGIHIHWFRFVAKNYAVCARCGRVFDANIEQLRTVDKEYAISRDKII